MLNLQIIESTGVLKMAYESLQKNTCFRIIDCSNQVINQID